MSHASLVETTAVSLLEPSEIPNARLLGIGLLVDYRGCLANPKTVLFSNLSKKKQGYRVLESQNIAANLSRQQSTLLIPNLGSVKAFKGAILFLEATNDVRISFIR
ncbi:hypothetical protein TNIN_350241 [Trichonephila inaurata madagascariensis]|uniref:Uncharacterized protein n=1 Tax=Trichonephila inaurata madagascariensis TaxID=2747483 RepID=A0A8X6YW89_9ARAC|nr:hypothetical protein TNIN_350241 [Trichonephila inaurata madagascariensis]